ncbi:unnamed protein product [Boreogadus saida]
MEEEVVELERVRALCLWTPVVSRYEPSCRKGGRSQGGSVEHHEMYQHGRDLCESLWGDAFMTVEDQVEEEEGGHHDGVHGNDGPPGDQYPGGQLTSVRLSHTWDPITSLRPVLTSPATQGTGTNRNGSTPNGQGSNYTLTRSPPPLRRPYEFIPTTSSPDVHMPIMASPRHNGLLRHSELMPVLCEEAAIYHDIKRMNSVYAGAN